MFLGLILGDLEVIVQHVMYILNTLTPALNMWFAVINEVFLDCFSESVSLRELGESNSCTKISSYNSLYLKAVKRALKGSALTGSTSRLSNSNRKENSHKIKFFLLQRNLKLKLSIVAPLYTPTNVNKNHNPFQKLKIYSMYLDKKMTYWQGT